MVNVEAPFMFLGSIRTSTAILRGTWIQPLSRYATTTCPRNSIRETAESGRVQLLIVLLPCLHPARVHRHQYRGDVPRTRSSTLVWRSYHVRPPQVLTELCTYHIYSLQSLDAEMSSLQHPCRSRFARIGRQCQMPSRLGCDGKGSCNPEITNRR